MITTLHKIRAHSPCLDGWEKLLRHLGKTAADDEPLPISTILDSNGLDDALWCLRAVEDCDREIRLYAVWCARQVQHLMADPRSIAALDVAERFARGRASNAELRAAWAKAPPAAWAKAPPAASAAKAAASAAEWSEARASAALTAAWAAEWAAAWAAAWAEMAAWASAAASPVASASAVRQAQADELRRVCREIEAGRDPYPEEEGR